MKRVLSVARRGWKPAVFGAALAAAVTIPWWGPRVLGQLSFFRLRHIEVQGAQYLQPADVRARLALDTAASVWYPTDVLERRVAAHPQVRSVEVSRKLPGTLVVKVTENLPVALVPSAEGMRVVDAAGRRLPIDPSRVHVDLPILARRDTALLRLLEEVRTHDPALFDRISNVRRTGRDELLVDLASVAVRARADLSAPRLADIVPVENDLARRRARATELDLRFRDQVIARLQ
ncbi:MAG: FtsQ-type POTRA domain-containing protein [Chloroflexota bacterium]|nr:FtsQ-type POTRA domain-containing protein [Chloroflexota bacterium]